MLFTSSSARSSARFRLEQCSPAGGQDKSRLSDSSRTMLASRNLGPENLYSGLLTCFGVFVRLGDSFSDCLCCAFEFGTGLSRSVAVSVPAFSIRYVTCQHVSRARGMKISLRFLLKSGASSQALRASRLAIEQDAPGAWHGRASGSAIAKASAVASARARASRLTFEQVSPQDTSQLGGSAMASAAASVARFNLEHVWPAR